ncbi:MAG: tetratricopeptide repeat protein [Acetobacteraceae bacterium]|jgi:tetratricopeptide (TPR) repeat protein
MPDRTGPSATPAEPAAGGAQAASALDATAHDELRQIARDSYSRGDLAEAIDLQLKVVAAGPPTANDALFLALMLFATRDLAGGIGVLRDSLVQFPDNPALHENLAVCLVTSGQLEAAVAACHRALALGSASPNVHDCLCDALNRLGQTEAGIAAGRTALEAKHLRFGGREPIVRIPPAPPPPFNPGNPAANVISYCLWGNEPRYLAPLQESVRILPHLFPAWSMRVYYDTTVDHHYITDLGKRGVQLRQMILPQGQPGYRRLLWRFEVIRDPSVQRFLIRDADALLNIKERVAVDAWLQSDYYFHAMRDWHSHTDLILAGMWGGVGNILPSPTELFRASTSWRVENNHVDQDILSDTVWPTICHSILIHDSVFTGTLGSVPFPPFGQLPAGSHIGQNAFVHFSRTE